MQSLEEICVVCQQGFNEGEDLVKPCRQCSVHTHERCLKLMVTVAVRDRAKSRMIDPKQWLLWLFNHKQYEQQRHPPPSRFSGNIVLHYRQSLTCGFVSPNIQSFPSIISMLILTNMKPDDSFFILCPNCRNLLPVYGRKPFLSGVTEFINGLKSIALASASASVIVGITTFSLFSIAATFAFNLNWANDFFRQTERVEYTELARFIMVPHFVYTMVTPNVGLLQLLMASIYSTFSYGIPAFGPTAVLKRFIFVKLVATLGYRLTFNRYYYESFRQTIPAVFGLKLSVEDALAIQDYRNETVQDEYYDLRLLEKCFIWIKDTWYCLWNDFGDLYRISGWDLVFGNYGFISTFLAGLLFAESPFSRMVYSIYLPEYQNGALAKLVGIAFTQLVYFCISTFDSCALAKSYKNLKPGEGYLGISKVRKAAAIVFEDFNILQLGL